MGREGRKRKGNEWGKRKGIVRRKRSGGAGKELTDCLTALPQYESCI